MASAGRPAPRSPDSQPDAGSATRPRVGISRCLLGDEVRYDGGHRRDDVLVAAFGGHVEWVPVCPEVEMGMGTPREPIHLAASDTGLTSGARRVRLVGVTSGQDWTAAMARWRGGRVRDLVDADLAGYVLKKNSPSCGLDGVRVHGAGGVTADGRGLFAQALVDAMPNLPVVEEGRLRDARVRENFVERVFAFDRLRRFFSGRWTVGGLVAFHTAHKLQLLSHSREAYDALGRLVARAKAIGRRELSTLYQGGFMQGLARMATPARHSDVMLHAAGHLKKHIDAASRDELLSAIEGHRSGVVPLAVPVTLLRHHVRRHGVAYLAGQSYLEPHPRELCLRNHV